MYSLSLPTVASNCGSEAELSTVFKVLELVLENVYCTSYSVNFHLCNPCALLIFFSICSSFIPAKRKHRLKFFSVRKAV